MYKFDVGPLVLCSDMVMIPGGLPIQLAFRVSYSRTCISFMCIQLLCSDLACISGI